MTGLVFAVGVLLVLVGAAAIVSGAPIVQLERGWTEVIAGTVAVSGGAVTFALGVVLLRLQALNETARAALRPAAVVESSDFEAAPLRRTLSPDEAVVAANDDPVESGAEPMAVTPVEPEPAADRPSLWKRLGPPVPPVAVEDEPAAAIVAEPPATTEGPTAPFFDIAPEAALPAVEPVIAEASADASLPPRRLLAPSSDLSTAETIGGSVKPASYARDWLTRPLLRARSPKVEPPEPPPLFADPPERDHGDVPLVADVHPPADEASLAPPIEGLSRPDEAAVVAPSDAPTLDEVTVVGRYQAGASSYTMYSDGAIDVETENGEVHRFESMDELKAFIARQESALS